MNKIARYVTMGVLLLGTSFGVGMLTGKKIAENQLEKKVEECSKRVLKQMERHGDFLQQLPNFDATGMWLDGSGYEAWMIKDINYKYDKYKPTLSNF